MPEDGFKMLQVFGTAIVCDVHRITIAVVGTVVNNDGKGSSSPDHLAWSCGALSKKKKKTGSILLFDSCLGFLALLHFGLEDGKAGLASSSPWTMLQGGFTLLACQELFCGLCCIVPLLLMI